MLVDSLDISEDIRDALKKQGFVELHPPQAEAVPKALSGGNLVVAVPTASGKSLIGYIAALKTMLELGKKVLYIVPLKALAAEKKDDMDRFAHLGFRTAISIGDLDSDDRLLRDADIVVATSEKADSLMRHGSRWIDDVGLVIADEIHMLHDPGRGPTLEVALTKMMRRNPDLQVIALSATVSNPEEMAMWLDADLVRSDWRPVELREGVFYDDAITFTDGSRTEIPRRKEEVLSLVHDMVLSGGQCLVFVNARRSTEALASRYGKDLKEASGMVLTEEEKSILEGDAESTSLGRKLAACVSCGIAFHHAGLSASQRRFVEDGFRAGRIKCIVATPTLAAGINLPARRVVVRDTTRFEAGSANSPIPVMEIKQMCGRAGRPGYDPYGEAVLIARSESDAEHLMQDYLEHETERVTSKLGNEKTLRTHILGLVATGDADSVDSVIGFLRDSFYGCQSELYGVEGAVENVTEFLVENGMVTEDGDGILAPTPLGKRVSDLYIDPESAMILKGAIERMDADTEDFLILHAVASTPDVMGLFPKKKDRDELLAVTEKYEGRFLTDVPDPDDVYASEYFFGDLKTAMLAQRWIDEVDEETLTESMGIGPGDIRSRMDSMEWLLYAMTEMAVLLRKDVVRRLRPMLTRVRYGVGSELLELVSLRGVGRARARTLFDRGIRGREDIVSADIGDLASMPRIGYALAASIKEQCGARVEERMPSVIAEEKEEDKKADAPAGPKQSSLFDF